MILKKYSPPHFRITSLNCSQIDDDHAFSLTRDYIHIRFRNIWMECMLLRGSVLSSALVHQLHYAFGVWYLQCLVCAVLSLFIMLIALGMCWENRQWKQELHTEVNKKQKRKIYSIICDK